MEQRVSLITLGVADLPRAIAFYEGLGWQNVSQEEGIAAFNLIGQTIGLYPWEHLARDMGVNPDQFHMPRSTLGYNVREAHEIDAVIDLARSLGATILREPHDVFWGGRASYFSDLDGHIWEVGHNPFSPLRASDGAFRWGGGYSDDSE